MAQLIGVPKETAAALALAMLVQGGFELVERWCNPLARLGARP